LIGITERITDSRNFELALRLFEEACNAAISCSNFSHLIISKLKVRLVSAKIHSLGVGADTFDITYIVIAFLIIVVALMGAHNLIFLAAAMRYMFQGTRMGGRKI
jgi:hypothetical protein